MESTYPRRRLCNVIPSYLKVIHGCREGVLITLACKTQFAIKVSLGSWIVEQKNIFSLNLPQYLLFLVYIMHSV